MQHIRSAVAMCPDWPNEHSPTAKEVPTLMTYEKIHQIIPCKWVNKMDPHMPQPSTGYSVTFLCDDLQSPSSELAKKKKFFYCTTHDKPAIKAWLRNKSLYFHIRAKLWTWWQYIYHAEKDENGVYMNKSKYIRIRTVTTIRSMWK